MQNNKNLLPKKLISKELICLGIESTAHTFGIGVMTSSGKILSNVKDMYTNEKAGIIPIEAGKHHKLVSQKILEQALNEAKISLDKIDLIAYSHAPGLAPCLKEGTLFAKELGTKLKIPVIPVNHCIAHLEIGKLISKTKDPVFLFTSGANTQIISYSAKKYRVFGETLDIGVGNFIDNFARSIGIGFPGGPKIEAMALNGKELIELPYTIKGMDIAFSGLLTNLKQKYNSKKYSLEDLSFSLQETAFAMLGEVTERAMAHLQKKELVLIGGVGANKRFCEMLKIMCEERDAKFFSVPLALAGDQGVMIAWLGILMYSKNKSKYIKTKQSRNLDFDSTERVDDIKAFWVDD